jgi:hypothetical protein
MGHRPHYEHRPVKVDKTFDSRARELIAQQSTDHIAKRIADSTRDIEDPKQLVTIEDISQRAPKRINHPNKKGYYY